MAAEDNLNIEDLLKTNQRLSEQLKEVGAENEELRLQISELEKNLEAVKKTKGQSKQSDKKKGITVMFIELQGFKGVQKGEDTAYMFDLLEEIYIRFDEIIAKHKLERVKSIGDDYICAGGIAEKKIHQSNRHLPGCIRDS